MTRRYKSEQLLRTLDDPDLGRLELWGWRRPREGFDFGKDLDTFEWRGSIGQLPMVIGVDVGVEPEAQLRFLDPEVRAAIKSLAGRELEIRSEAATRELALARDWSNNPEYSQQDFTQALRAMEIDVYTDANDTIIDLTFEDKANIFAGHVLIVSMDKTGSITDTGIHG